MEYFSSEKHEGLEHYNPQDEFPHVLPGQDPQPLHFLSQLPDTEYHKGESKVATVCGIRRPTFWLSVALAIVCGIAVIGVGVAGSLVASSRSGHGNSSASQPSSSTSTGPQQPTSTLIPPWSGSSAPSVSTATSSNSPASKIAPSATAGVVPVGKSGCQKMVSPYTSRHQGITYDINCGVDFHLSDLFGIYVGSFEDCIDACSSLRSSKLHMNTSCGSVTYSPGLDPHNYEGNCYLKDGLADIVPVADPGSFSAKILTNNS